MAKNAKSKIDPSEELPSEAPQPVPERPVKGEVLDVARAEAKGVSDPVPSTPTENPITFVYDPSVRSLRVTTDADEIADAPVALSVRPDAITSKADFETLIMAIRTHLNNNGWPPRT